MIVELIFKMRFPDTARIEMDRVTDLLKSQRKVKVKVKKDSSPLKEKVGSEEIKGTAGHRAVIINQELTRPERLHCSTVSVFRVLHLILSYFYGRYSLSERETRT